MSRPRPTQTEPKVRLARKLHADGGVTLDAIRKTLHISPTTYFRHVEAGRSFRYVVIGPGTQPLSGPGFAASRFGGNWSERDAGKGTVAARDGSVVVRSGWQDLCNLRACHFLLG